MRKQQPTLFDLTPDPWDVDSQQDLCVAQVVFSQGIEGVLDYRVPDVLRPQVTPGKRVRVPLGRSNRGLVAYCVGVTDQPEHPGRLKDILSVIDREPIASAHMLQLTQWMSDYYLCPWGRVLEGVVPAGVRNQSGTREVTLLRVVDPLPQHLETLKLSDKQQAVMRYARTAGPMMLSQLCRAVGCSSAPVQSLRKKGLLVADRQRVRTDWEADEAPLPDSPPVPNVEQAEAIRAITTGIQSDRSEVYLLHGVTGSGKTEVYMRAIEQVVADGRQAIVLVPEISLTPQTCRRFRARFSRIAVLHSHLSDVERHRHWQQITAGHVQVVVGARSAVFAPAPHLGLIVMDEEHDASFKQDTVPRYHARDVALQRAALERVPVVLGSATPSLESWYRAQRGKATVIRMGARIRSLPLPHVDIIDTRSRSFDRKRRGAISRQLELQIRAAFKERGQVILLLNRRGFSTHIQCPACGEVVRCPECDISLTHHREQEQAVCHYCDFQQPAPPRCPACQFEGIRYGGLGTQRLEAEVRARFPDKTCLRMDSDSMKRPGSHEEALSRFRSGEVDILLGTQMIAKGLDFPNVTLVGVINADTALNLPDFRAAERTFQLITQVAGRTGRGEKGGRVLVQAFQPEHPAVVAAASHDYQQFVAGEVPLREQFGYPPFGAMLRLVVRGTDEKQTLQFADDWVASIQVILEQHGTNARVLGPVPAPIARLRGKFRFHALLQSPQGRGLREAVRESFATLKTSGDVQWVVDVDPLDML